VSLEATAGIQVTEPVQARSRVLRRLLRRPVAVVAIIVIVVIYGAGIFAPLVAPYGFSEADLHNPYQGPFCWPLIVTDWCCVELLSRACW
jgi:hypothetical protein